MYNCIKCVVLHKQCMCSLHTGLYYMYETCVLQIFYIGPSAILYWGILVVSILCQCDTYIIHLSWTILQKFTFLLKFRVCWSIKFQNPITFVEISSFWLKTKQRSIIDMYRLMCNVILIVSLKIIYMEP